MPDLPSIETVGTGGLIAAVLAATGWLVKWFAGLATHGEDIAARRIAALEGDFAAYRERTQTELKAVRAELALVQAAQRKCVEDSAATNAELAAVKAELARLKP